MHLNHMVLLYIMQLDLTIMDNAVELYNILIDADFTVSYYQSADVVESH